MKVCVIGTKSVGLVTGACLAAIEHDVIAGVAERQETIAGFDIGIGRPLTISAMLSHPARLNVAPTSETTQTVLQVA